MAGLGFSCDKCGQHITTNRTVINLETGPMRASLPTADLCEPCAGELVAWLKTPADNIAAIEPKPLVRAKRSA